MKFHGPCVGSVGSEWASGVSRCRRCDSAIAARSGLRATHDDGDRHLLQRPSTHSARVGGGQSLLVPLLGGLDAGGEEQGGESCRTTGRRSPGGGSVDPLRKAISFLEIDSKIRDVPRESQAVIMRTSGSRFVSTQGRPRKHSHLSSRIGRLFNKRLRSCQSGCMESSNAMNSSPWVGTFRWASS